MASRFPSGLGTATSTLHHPTSPDLDSPLQPPAKHGSKAHLLKAAVQSLKGQAAQGAPDDEGTGRVGDHAAEAARVGRSRPQGSRQPKKLRQHICLDSEERERCRRVWEDFREEKGLAYVSVSNEDGLLRTDHVSYAQELLARLGQHPLSEDTVRSLLSGTKFTATHQHALTLDELCQVMGRIKRRVHKQKKDPVDVITRVLGTHADSLLCPSPLSTERIYKDVHRRHQQRDAEQRATSAAGVSATSAAAAATASGGVDGDSDIKSPRCGEGLVGKELASAGAVRLAFSDAMFAAGKRKTTPAVSSLVRPPSFNDASPPPPGTTAPAAAVSSAGLLAADVATAPQPPAPSSAPAAAHAAPVAPDAPAPHPPLRHPCDPRHGPPQARSGRRLQAQTLARVQAATRRQAARLEAARAKREGLEAAHALLREVAAEGVAKIRQVVGVVNAAAESAERAESVVVAAAAAVGPEAAVRSGGGSSSSRRLVVARRGGAEDDGEEKGEEEEEQEEEALRRVIAAQVAALGKQSASGTALIKSVDALDATLQSKWRRFYKDDLQYRERVGGGKVSSPRSTQHLRRKPVPPPRSKGRVVRATHGCSTAAPTALRRSASLSCLVASAGTALTSTTESEHASATLRVADAALCATQGEADGERLMDRYTQTGSPERPRNMAPRSGRRDPVRQYAYLRGV